VARIPTPTEFPTIRKRLRFYQVTSVITGVLLLLLVFEMLLKYIGHVEIELGGPFGFLALVQEDTVTAINLSRWILIVHGWFYVIYLISCYLLWQKMRWELGWLLALAGGGVVPFLSFITEALISRRTKRLLGEYQEIWDETDDEDARVARVEAELSDEERAALDAKVAEEVRRRQEN
jgi:integral membrane protein